MTRSAKKVIMGFTSSLERERERERERLRIDYMF